METASHDTTMAHHQTGKPGYAAAKNAPGLTQGPEIGPAGSDAQPGPSRRSIPQSAQPDEAASPKGWCATEKLLVPGLMSGTSCHAVLSPVLAADITEQHKLTSRVLLVLCSLLAVRNNFELICLFCSLYFPPCRRVLDAGLDSKSRATADCQAKSGIQNEMTYSKRYITIMLA